MTIGEELKMLITKISKQEGNEVQNSFNLVNLVDVFIGEDNVQGKIKQFYDFAKGVLEEERYVLELQRTSLLV